MGVSILETGAAAENHLGSWPDGGKERQSQGSPHVGHAAFLIPLPFAGTACGTF